MRNNKSNFAKLYTIFVLQLSILLLLLNFILDKNFLSNKFNSYLFNKKKILFIYNIRNLVRNFVTFYTFIFEYLI